MKVLLISLILGAFAGVLDILPMVIRRMDPLFIASAFLFWVVTAVVTAQVAWTSWGWLNGTITALIVMLPTLLLIFKVDIGAVPVVIVTNAVLGAAMGFTLKVFLQKAAG